jgi:hypothetical protein
MTYVDDLLSQSARLVEAPERGRPRQVELRRGVSAAYYALFHEVVDQAVDHTLKGRRPAAEVRSRLRRVVTHKAIKDAAGWLTQGKPPRVIEEMLAATTAPRDLVLVCRLFIELQEARHRADYELTARWTLHEARLQVEKAKRAVTKIRTLDHDSAFRVFLLGCLLGDRLTASPR